MTMDYARPGERGGRFAFVVWGRPSAVRTRIEDDSEREETLSFQLVANVGNTLGRHPRARPEDLSTSPGMQR